MARFRLERVMGKVKITYKGAFYRKYLNNDPPPEENDEAAIAAVTKNVQRHVKKIKKKLVSNKEHVTICGKYWIKKK